MYVTCPHCKKYTTLFAEEIETGVITRHINITGFNEKTFEFRTKEKIIDIDFYNTTRNMITSAKCKKCGALVDLQPIRQKYIDANVEQRKAEERREAYIRRSVGGEINTLPELEKYFEDAGITEVDW